MELLRYRIYSEDGTISFQKPVMVLVHGFGGGCATWLYQVHDLKAHYDLLLVELPSHGRSKLKLSRMNPDFSSVSDLILNVMDHLGIQKASFLGVSLGTMVIQHFIYHHPERVDKYIFCGAVCKYQWWHKAAVRILQFLLPILPLKLAIVLVSRIIIPYNSLARGRELFVASANRIPREEFAAWIQAIWSFRKMYKLYAEKMQEEPNGLYIMGELDYFFLAMLKRDRKRIKHLTLVKDAGHLCCIDQCEAVNQLVIQFQNTGSVHQETAAAK